MKLLQTIIFICFSVIARGQDVTFMLTHAGNKKWVGLETTRSLNGNSSTNLVFHANHKVEEQPVNSHRSPVTKRWQLISGATTHDENIQLEIGGITYSVIFSKTANGSDFMTLSYYKDERAVTRSYFSE